MLTLLEKQFPTLSSEVKSDLEFLINKNNNQHHISHQITLWLDTYLNFLEINKKVFYKSFNIKINNSNLLHSDTPIKRSYIAKEITKIHLLLFADKEKQTSEEFIEYNEQEIENHIQFLEQAISNESILLFTEYIAWLNSVHSSLGMTTNTLIRLLVSMKLVVNESVLHKGTIYLDSALRLLNSGNIVSTSSSICFTQTPESKKYLSLTLNKQKNEAKDFIIELIENGKDIKSIYTEIFQASQYELGRLWELNEISVAQEHYCTAVTNSIISIVAAQSNYIKKNGLKAITTCVGSEQHAMGIRIINDFLEFDGWETYYMGANVPSKAILSAIQEIEPDFIALSVTLTPHIKQLKEIISDIKSNIPSLKIIVGGYPFLRDKVLWQKVGADGFALNAWDINEEALRLLEKK